MKTLVCPLLLMIQKLGVCFPCLFEHQSGYQPRHRQVSGQQVKRDEPGRGGNHETCRHTTTKKDCANHISYLCPVGRRDQVSGEAPASVPTACAKNGITKWRGSKR